jgi:hypothetical protein
MLMMTLMIVSSNASATPIKTPREVVTTFVNWYFQEKVGGSFPIGKDRKALKPLESRRFMDLLEAVDRADKRCAAIENGPPLVEGDLFVSLAEGATASEKITEVERTESKATYSVRWVYATDRAGYVPEKWSDRIHLRKINGSWVIDDFSHDGTWSFMSKGTVGLWLKELSKACS